MEKLIKMYIISLEIMQLNRFCQNRHRRFVNFRFVEPIYFSVSSGQFAAGLQN